MLDLNLDKGSKILVLEIDELEAQISESLIGGDFNESEMLSQIRSLTLMLDKLDLQLKNL